MPLHFDGYAAGPEMVAKAFLAFLPVGVCYDFTVRVREDKAAPVKGPGLLQGWLDSAPVLVFLVVTGNHSVDPSHPKLLAAGLEAVGFNGGYRAYQRPHRAQGEGKCKGEGQYQPELKASEPTRHCQAGTPSRRWCGCTWRRPGAFQACGAGCRCGYLRCGRTRQSPAPAPGQ